MADPLTLAVAAAAAGKAVELTGQPVKDGIVAITRKVRERFRGRPADEEALQGAIADADDAERVARLTEALRRAFAEAPEFADDLWSAVRYAMDQDPDFRAHVENRLRQVRTATATSGDGVTNIVSAPAEKVFQMRDVNGGIHFH
ncbi:hypothetical protein [Actinomadura keratinilytica]|jgi:hypothetical protein|uniref:Uncharacterized protein n=1 Tax=Actinomadura keratinilytica TaxID=547461 RepID=A0ABP7XZX7_9ACTN